MSLRPYPQEPQGFFDPPTPDDEPEIDYICPECGEPVEFNEEKTKEKYLETLSLTTKIFTYMRTNYYYCTGKDCGWTGTEDNLPERELP